jgi:hypothetical protein
MNKRSVGFLELSLWMNKRSVGSLELSLWMNKRSAGFLESCEVGLVEDVWCGSRGLRLLQQGVSSLPSVCVAGFYDVQLTSYCSTSHSPLATIRE